MYKQIASRLAAVVCLAATLTPSLPAFADGGGESPPDSIITPGFGTLGAIIDWLRLMIS